jgi:hypothetical protein
VTDSRAALLSSRSPPARQRADAYILPVLCYPPKVVPHVPTLAHTIRIVLVLLQASGCALKTRGLAEGEHEEEDGEGTY